MKTRGYTIFLLGILLAISACNGQHQSPQQNTNSSPNSTEHSFSWNSSEAVSGIGTNIDCIFQDNLGHYWFGSNGEGLYCYDGKTITHKTEKDGLCSNYILSIQQDVNGVLWFSTRDGFCSYNGLSFTDQTKTIKEAPYGKLKYTTGGLFFGHLNGICFYDGRSFTNFVISPDSYKPADSDMARPYNIYTVVADHAGNIWFGTQSEGVAKYDRQKVTYLKEKNLAGPAVRAAYEDKAGILWFGNNGGGLFRYDGKTLTNITEERGLGNPEFLKGRFNDKMGSLARIFALNGDSEGNLWIGTVDAGVWKFDGSNLTNYTTKDGLPGNAVWVIYKDHKGELWFVTDGNALSKFNGKSFEKIVLHNNQ